MLEDLAENSGVQIIYLKTVLKIIGIAYIAEMGPRSYEMPDRNRSHQNRTGGKSAHIGARCTDYRDHHRDGPEAPPGEKVGTWLQE